MRTARLISILITLLLAGSLLPAASLVVAAAPATGRVGRPVPAVAGQRVNPHELAAPQAPVGDTPQKVKEAPRRFPVDAATYGRLKGQADAAAQARDRGGEGSLGSSPAPKFATLGFGESGRWNPPDGALAVGPTSVLTVANEAWALYDRSGTRVLGPVSLQAFFGAPSTTSVYDPRALFDAGNATIVNGAPTGYGAGHGRFVLLATDGTHFDLAVSQNESPQDTTTHWCTYQLNGVTTNANGSTDWVDYPSLGMDGDYLYLTSNQFSNVDNSFQYARLMVVAKASIYPDAISGACPLATTAWDFDNLQNPGGGASFTVQPATQPDALPGTGGSMYLVNAIWSSGSNLVVRSVTAQPGAAPVLNAPNWVTAGWIAPYSLPASAPQPGGTKIDTGDTRLLGAVYRYGSIYTANTTGTVSSSLSASPNPYANVQWYQITPTSATPPITSTGSSAAITNSSVAFFFPGILPVCASGPTCTSPKVVLETSVSGRKQPASAVRVANGLAAVFGAGVGGYTLNSRWGDYPAVAADPTSPGTAWLFGEYAAASNAWGTATTNVTP